MEGAQNIDWEDISIGEYEGEFTLFIGDIGDNLAARNTVVIYLVAEPESDATNVRIERKIELGYEDGARDAELLLVDSKFNELLETLEAEKIKLKSKIPIVVKISPDIPDEQIESISKTLIKYKVRAIIVSNTTASNREKLEDVTKHQKGGLSGKPLEDISNKLIGKFYKLLKDKIEIIGVGGVDSGESAYRKFVAGASFVQLYTGMVFQGPSVVRKIKKELKKILINEGVKSFKEIIGRNHTNQL